MRLLPLLLALVLMLMLLMLSGCVTTPPQAKPSVPPGVTAPDPKPANDAQAATDAAASDRLSKLSANVNAAATAPNIEASPVAVNELTVAKGRLSDVTPDPVEVAAAAERRALVEAGKAEEARQNAEAAAGQGRTDAARIRELEATAATLTAKYDASVAAYAAQAEKNRLSNQKAIDDAVARANNVVLKDQVAKLNWFGFSCLAGAALIGALGVGLGGLVAAKRVVPLVVGLLLLGFGALGAAQIVGAWWFLWAVGAAILVVCGGFGIWAWRHYKARDLAAELAARSAKVAKVAQDTLPVLDTAYETATGEIKDWLDEHIFNRLSSVMDKSTKATVHEIRATSAKS